MSEKPDQQPLRDPLPLVGADDQARLTDGFRKLLRETDEKTARRIIAALGRPEGTPEFEYFLRCWCEQRETEGWKVS